MLGLLTENGPCTVTPDGLSTVNNPFSWNTNANVMWVDQPAQVGYSYGATGADLDHNEAEIAEDMYNFLLEFFKAHPEYAENEFYVFGESYGGHYAPSIASRINQGNVNNEGPKINLRGLGVGNGLTDPLIQYQYYPAMAMNNTYGIKCVSEETYQKMVDHVPTCEKFILACQVFIYLIIINLNALKQMLAQHHRLPPRRRLLQLDVDHALLPHRSQSL